MLAAGAGLRIAHDFTFVIDVYIRSVFGAAIAPAAEADHFVELGPLGPAVVCGVHHNQSTTLGHVFFKILACRFGPACGIPAEIADHYGILGEIRTKIRVGNGIFFFLAFTRSRTWQPFFFSARIP